MTGIKLLHVSEPACHRQEVYYSLVQGKILLDHTHIDADMCIHAADTILTAASNVGVNTLRAYACQLHVL